MNVHNRIQSHWPLSLVVGFALVINCSISSCNLLQPSDNSLTIIHTYQMLHSYLIIISTSTLIYFFFMQTKLMSCVSPQFKQKKSKISRGMRYKKISYPLYERTSYVVRTMSLKRIISASLSLDKNDVFVHVSTQTLS